MELNKLTVEEMRKQYNKTMNSFESPRIIYGSEEYFKTVLGEETFNEYIKTGVIKEGEEGALYICQT